MNFDMNGCEKPILDLHVMFKTVEKNIPIKTTHDLWIREGETKKPEAKKSKAKFVKVNGKKIAKIPTM